jgi:hypothetical protein
MKIWSTFIFTNLKIAKKITSSKTPHFPPGFRYSDFRSLLFECYVVVFNATFNNISDTSLLSVLLMEEIGENQRPAASY